MLALLPDDENERLAALHRYEVLDTPPERSFDRLTRMTARAFNAPVSLITFVDSQRQFFKSHHGFQINETAREQSFCAHSILCPGITVATDTTTDPRFADNHFVVNAPHVRFYAAAPLTTPDGFRLGTLCVLDMQPRSLPDPSLLALLGDLADEVVEQMDLHLHRKRLTDQSAALEIPAEIFCSPSVAHCTPLKPPAWAIGNAMLLRTSSLFLLPLKRCSAWITPPMTVR